MAYQARQTRHLTLKEVNDIHNTHVKKSSEYLNRFTSIDDVVAAGVTEHYPLRGRDAPRVFTLIDFRDWVAKYKIHARAALAFSDDPELEFLPRDALTMAVYKPETEEYDLHCLDLPDKSFDFILLSQTLEHLHSPEVAMCRLYDHLTPGGYLFTSVPTISIPHCVPTHFQEIHPDGLACLAARSGFDILEVGYWGNIDYCVKMFTGHHSYVHTRRGVSWPDIYALNTVANDAEFPAQSWILVRKPVETK